MSCQMLGYYDHSCRVQWNTLIRIYMFACCCLVKPKNFVDSSQTGVRMSCLKQVTFLEINMRRLLQTNCILWAPQWKTIVHFHYWFRL